MKNIEVNIMRITKDFYDSNNQVDSFNKIKNKIHEYLLSKDIIKNTKISISHKYSYTKNKSYIESDLVNLPNKRPDLIKKGYREYFQTFYNVSSKQENITIIISELYSYSRPIYLEIKVEPENKIYYSKVEFLPSGIDSLL